MRFIDYSYREPDYNLAVDEALLNAAETGEGGESLRIWESPSPFVVLGVAQVLHDEADEQQCASRGVPILRRCSAGGCVLQGPGCLNFSLVLDSERRPELKSIHGSYEAILGKLTGVLTQNGILAERAGTSDLAVAGRKISGNAQRRKRRYILHHGTLLYAIEMDLMQACLREPSERPVYRGDRGHGDFLVPLTVPRERLYQMIVEAFAPGESKDSHTLSEAEIRETSALAEGKYSRSDWIYRR
jgi:lipoate-protein ligase A